MQTLEKPLKHSQKRIANPERGKHHGETQDSR
jgi:hypothetical protein